LLDTPEVEAAKQQFYAAYNSALAATASGPAPVVVAASVDDTSAPVALPYLHEEIEAEPYIHVDIPAEPYVHEEPAEGLDDVSVAVAGPVINNPVFAGPVQQVAYTGGCYNYRGEGVPCRTIF